MKLFQPIFLRVERPESEVHFPKSFKVDGRSGRRGNRQHKDRAIRVGLVAKCLGHTLAPVGKLEFEGVQPAGFGNPQVIGDPKLGQFKLSSTDPRSRFRDLPVPQERALEQDFPTFVTHIQGQVPPRIAGPEGYRTSGGHTMKTTHAFQFGRGSGSTRLSVPVEEPTP